VRYFARSGLIAAGKTNTFNCDPSGSYLFCACNPHTHSLTCMAVPRENRNLTGNFVHYMRSVID
jgi:hypothetical protein